jgi:hypothetical protein
VTDVNRTKSVPMLGLLAAVALLLGACVADADRVGELEDRVERLERSLATTTTSTTTSTLPLGELEIPPISLPVEQARTRLQRRLPAPLSALWELEWCRDHPAALGDAASGHDGALPARPSDGDVEALIAGDPGLFGEICAAALGGADGVVPSDYDDGVEAALAATVAEIVEEAAADPSALEAALGRLSPGERSFCSANLESVFDAAFAAGRLPQGASSDLERYWSVVRPDEFAAACRIAAAPR